MEHWLDNLARNLAGGRSRRAALRQLGAGLVGLVGSLLPSGLVRAQDGGNSACADWCNAVFSGPARGSCKSEAAHGRGPCYDCGPGAPAGSDRVLADGHCVQTCRAGEVLDATTRTCGCPSGQKPCGDACIPNEQCCSDEDCSGGKVCQSGACVCPSGRRPCGSSCIPDGDCCTGAECSGGKVCLKGACVCPSGQRPCGKVCIPTGDCCSDGDCSGGKTCQGGDCACPSGAVECGGACYDPCEDKLVLNPRTCVCECKGGACGKFKRCGGGGCICLKTAEGGGLCARSRTPCKNLAHCETSDDCPKGASCVIRSCCRRRGVCVPPEATCAADDVSPARVTPTGDGKTLGGG